MKNQLNKLVPAIIGWLGVIITLALSPTIETYNGHVTTNVSGAVNSAQLIGMSAISPWGGFIMVMVLLLGTGIFAWQGMRSKNVTIGDLIGIIGAVIISVFALAVFSGSIIGFIDALVTAGATAVKPVYGSFAILVYAAIIGGAGAYSGAKAFRSRRRSRRTSARYM